MKETPPSVSFWPSSNTLLGFASLAAYESNRDTKTCSCLRSTPSSMRTAPTPHWRSEEHTSELQSQSNLVCRLLLEKKKNTTTRTWGASALQYIYIAEAQL